MAKEECNLMCLLLANGKTHNLMDRQSLNANSSGQDAPHASLEEPVDESPTPWCHNACATEPVPVTHLACDRALKTNSRVISVSDPPPHHTPQNMLRKVWP